MFPLLYIFTVARYLMVNKVVYNVYWVSLCVYTGITEQARTLPSIKKHQTYEDPHTLPRTFRCPRKDDLTSIAIRAHRTRPCCVLRTAFVGVCVCVHRRSQEFVFGGLATEAPKVWRSRRRRRRGGKGMGSGCPLPSRLWGLGERRPPVGKTSFGSIWSLKKYTWQPQMCHIWNFCGIYLVTFTFTITKHNTLT